MVAEGTLSSALTPPVDSHVDLSHTVLMLDNAHKPLALCSDDSTVFKPLQIPAVNAMEAMCTGKVYLVDWKGQYARARNGEYMPVPSVVALRKRGDYQYMHQSVLFNLKRLYIRDGATCQYSGRRVVIEPTHGLYKDPQHRGTFDHVLPRSKGGESCWENALLACESENTAKANLMPQRYKKPLTQPWLPTQADLLRLWLTDERLADVPLEWLTHIDRTPVTEGLKRHMNTLCDEKGEDSWSWQRQNKEMRAAQERRTRGSA